MTTEVLRHPVELNCVGVGKPKSPKSFRATLSQVAADSGRSYFNVLKEATILRLSEGSLSFDEYIELSLFDKNIFAATNRKAFIGLKASNKINLRANYRLDLYALVNNKVASDILFAAHGFPILPTVAIFREQVGRDGPFLLRSENELRGFLTNSRNYPLFGKPVSGYRSIGSESIDRYDAAYDCLITTTGHKISLETFISYVRTHSAFGYLFQQRISPHAAVREICGERLATLRLLTIMAKGQPNLLRACWKIPAGIHAADNFWRPGNLLAQLDLQSGQVLRVIRRNGRNYEEITHHPDTGTRILGTVVPNWQEVKLLAMDGAKVLEDLPLVGWDIAPVDSGVVMVEPNLNPDFRLHQLADRRGILDTTVKSFLADRKIHAADALRRARQIAKN